MQIVVSFRRTSATEFRACPVSFPVRSGLLQAGKNLYFWCLRSLFDDVETIHLKAGEFVDLAGRPVNLKRIDHCRLLQAKVEAKVVLRIVTATTAYFVDL